MESFRDAAANYVVAGKDVFLETEFVPLAFYKRFQKYFPFGNVLSLDAEIAQVRSVKSDYELQLMMHSGKMHEEVLEKHVPAMLNEGMSEVDLAALLYSKMLELGHHGVARFGMFDTEVILGHIAFGESSLYPTSFNGPGGNFGMSPAVPLIGNRNSKLKKGDLVFIDIGFGIDGYHTDKTLTYIFKGRPNKETHIAHQYCLDIQDRLALQLKPGAIPSQIYENLMRDLPADFMENFMGFGNRQVKFLGHGIGLVIDEYPVIAKGFDAPLEKNMVLALEPKKGIPGIGMVGIENTFLVTPNGGVCLTGNSRGMVEVD
jgi:Xaa-Pro aminopeptidase